MGEELLSAPHRDSRDAVTLWLLHGTKVRSFTDTELRAPKGWSGLYQPPCLGGRATVSLSRVQAACGKVRPQADDFSLEAVHTPL